MENKILPALNKPGTNKTFFVFSKKTGANLHISRDSNGTIILDTQDMRIELHLDDDHNCLVITDSELVEEDNDR